MSVINELAKKYIWETENRKIKIIPISQFEWQSYPIDKDYLLLTEDEFIGVATKLYMFSNDLKGVVPFDVENYRSFLKDKGIIK